MGRTIRVVMLIQSYHRNSYGGAERQLAALAPLLLARGIELSVVARGKPELDSYEQIDGVDVYRTLGRKIPGLRPLLYEIFGLATIKRLDPDVLHAHGLFSTASTAILAHRLFRIPVVCKVLRGGVLGDIIRLTKKPMGQHRMSQLRKHVRGFISISEEITAELIQNGISRDQCYYIPNGVDIKRFVPLEPDQKQLLREKMGLPNILTVIYSGRLVPEKRVNHLIESWKTVRAHFPESQLLILGNGAEREALEETAGEGIQFMGSVNNIQAWLQIADLYVLPSISEGLSNSLLEAMASQLPIIATAVGDAPNLIETGVNGWCIPPDDVQTLTDTLVDALGDLESLHRMGERSRGRILSDFQLSATADKLRALYENVLQSS